jgi:GNAT superfamily N-acetyltransferase
MQEFFYSHTQETIESRYGYMVSRMSRERAYELVNVDQTRDLALAILEMQGPREVIHAVGRYYLDADGKGAEVAFVTRETKRRLGMARILFDRLRAEAKKRGLASLHAQVAPENEAMLGLFQSYPTSSAASKAPPPSTSTCRCSHFPDSPFTALWRRSRERRSVFLGTRLHTLALHVRSHRYRLRMHHPTQVSPCSCPTPHAIIMRESPLHRA